MIEYDSIIESFKKSIKNEKAKSILLKQGDDHPTQYLHTRDSLLLLIVSLLKSAQKYDLKQFEKEEDEKYIYATDIDETHFSSVSDQWIQGLSIFESYEDLFSELLEIKEHEGDFEGINSLKNDPDLDMKNFK